MSQTQWNLIDRLVLTNGQVLTPGMPWPDENGKPMLVEGKEIDAHIWLIAYAPEVMEQYEADGTIYHRTLQPAQYKLMSRRNGTSGASSSGLPDASGTTVARVRDIGIDKVWHAERIQGFEDAYDEFQGYLRFDNHDLMPPDPDDEDDDELDDEVDTSADSSNGAASQTSDTSAS